MWTCEWDTLVFLMHFWGHCLEGRSALPSRCIACSRYKPRCYGPGQLISSKRRWMFEGSLRSCFLPKLVSGESIPSLQVWCGLFQSVSFRSSWKEWTPGRYERQWPKCWELKFGRKKVRARFFWISKTSRKFCWSERPHLIGFSCKIDNRVLFSHGSKPPCIWRLTFHHKQSPLRELCCHYWAYGQFGIVLEGFLYWSWCFGWRW